MKHLYAGVLLCLLAACCPTPQGSLQQATAFVGEVTQVAPDRLELRVTRASATRVPVLLSEQARILDAVGNDVSLSSIREGERVNVTGFLDAANTVIASEVRVLGRRSAGP